MIYLLLCERYITEYDKCESTDSRKNIVHIFTLYICGRTNAIAIFCF